MINSFLGRKWTGFTGLIRTTLLVIAHSLGLFILPDHEHEKWSNFHFLYLMCCVKENLWFYRIYNCALLLYRDIIIMDSHYIAYY